MTLYRLAEHAVATPGAGRFWVADTAIVIGRVAIEEDASIWFGAVVRGDNEPIRIGARSNIQENCVLHVDPGYPLVLEEECTIGHMAMLHGCHVERGSLIGIGAIVLNGARIGAGSMIGAGALVPEGKVIPPGSVVLGTPGKVVREVTPADRLRIDGGVRDYMARWKRYAAQLAVDGR